MICLSLKFGYLLKKKNSVKKYQHHIYIEGRIGLFQLKKLLYFLLLIEQTDIIWPNPFNFIL